MHFSLKYMHIGIRTLDLWKDGTCVFMWPTSPVKAVLQSLADSAEVGGVRHRSAVQRVVLQIHW